MNLKSTLTILALIVVSFGYCQKGDDILLTIEDENISSSEFMAIYNKNNVNIESSDKKSVEEYLELYVNFKLKVHEAVAQGMDTVPKFTREYNGYVNQLAKPYLVDQQFTEDLIKEAYERSKWEVRAKHIMIKIDEGASPQDTAVAYTKALEVYKMAVSDSSFSNVAVKYSDDPSVVKNGGDLGYFSAFRMVYPFETAAFTTPVGSVGKPIRTSFGYHIIKVIDKRPARGEIKAAHIMIISNDKTTDIDKANAEKKINEIYLELEKGGDFKKLATTYSDDRGSAKNGGDLGWFGAGRMVPEFESQAFSLKENGAYTKPFKTKFGWHIVLREDKRNLGSYEDEYDELAKKVKQDQRSLGNEKSLVSKLMVDYKVKLKKTTALELRAVIDSNYLEKNWLLSNADGMVEPIMTINDKKYGKQKLTYTQADFAQFIFDAMPRQKSRNLDIIVNEQFDAFVTKMIIAYERTILDLKYPEYKALITEYHDGILLFEIMEKEVWKKAIGDSVGIEEYYQAHIDEYMYEERLDATIFTCESSETALKVKELLEQGKSDSVILETLNKESQLAVQLRSDLFERSTESHLSDISKTGIYLPEGESQSVVVSVRELLPSQPKKISEVRGLVISSYQDQLDEEWIKLLKEKYSYSVHKEVLATIVE